MPFNWCYATVLAFLGCVAGIRFDMRMYSKKMKTNKKKKKRGIYIKQVPRELEK